MANPKRTAPPEPRLTQLEVYARELERSYEATLQLESPWFFRSASDYMELLDQPDLQPLAYEALQAEGEIRVSGFDALHGECLDRLNTVRSALMVELPANNVKIPRGTREELKRVFDDATYRTTGLLYFPRLSAVAGLVDMAAASPNGACVRQYLTEGRSDWNKILPQYKQLLRAYEKLNEYAEDSVYGSHQELVTLCLTTRNRTKLMEDLAKDESLSRQLGLANLSDAWQVLLADVSKHHQFFDVQRHRRNLALVHSRLLAALETKIANGTPLKRYAKVEIKARGFVADGQQIKGLSAGTKEGRFLAALLNSPSGFLSREAACGATRSKVPQLRRLRNKLNRKLAKAHYVLDWETLRTQGYRFLGIYRKT